MVSGLVRFGIGIGIGIGLGNDDSRRVALVALARPWAVIGIGSRNGIGIESRNGNRIEIGSRAWVALHCVAIWDWDWDWD